MLRGLPVLSLSLALIGGCAPPLPPSIARAERERVARSPVVDISQWPDRDRIGALLEKSSAPLVTFDGTTLEPLPGCAVAGRFAVDAVRASPASLLLRSEDEIRARFPLRDPALRLASATPGHPPPPLAVVSLVAEAWRLGTIDTNARPAGACARATHLVTGVRFGASAFRRQASIRRGRAATDDFDPERALDAELALEVAAACAGSPSPREGGPAAPAPCARPLSLTLTPIGNEELQQDASLVHFARPEGEPWSLSLGGAPLCSLPCDRWLLPGADVSLVHRGETLSYHAAPQRPREEELRIGYIKDPSYPLPWVVTAPFGAGLVAASLGLGLSGAASHAGTAGAPSSAGSSGIGTTSTKALLGLTGLGVLGALIAGGSLVGLARGPQLVPRLTTHAPDGTSRGQRGRARRAPVGITPSGAIAF